MGQDQSTQQPTLVSCKCGGEVKPGEDQCFSCLGESPPTIADYIAERPVDFSRVGTEEWKEEMRKYWPWRAKED